MLQGENLYKSKSVRDKQIVRIIGKVYSNKLVSKLGHLNLTWCLSKHYGQEVGYLFLLKVL